MLPSRVHIIISFLGLSVALYFACFHHIQRLPINLWDESLFFMRALHFFEQGSYMPNFDLYDYGVDHRNTKLPFTTFSQVLGLKLFGINTLALRVPVLIIFITTAFYSIKFFQREFGQYGIGIITTLVLISSTGFLRDHMLRTGDQDIPFACYILLATFFFYRFELRRQSADLWLFGFWVIAALLTKNLLIGLLLPGLILYCLIRGSFLALAKDLRVYLLLFVMTVIYVGLVGYYESRFPGFFDRMWNYELFGRYTNAVDGHDNNHFYFLENMGLKDFFPFLLLMPVAVFVLLILDKYKRYRNFVILSAAVFLMYFLGISISSTRLFWYSAPLYPLGAVIIALMFFPEVDTENHLLLRRLPFVGFLLLLLPYSIAMQSINNPKTEYQSSKLGSFLENLERDRPELRKFSFFDNSFGTGAGFYIEQAKRKGIDIDFKRLPNFGIGEYVSLCRHKMVPHIDEKYTKEKIYDDPDCVIYRITTMR